MNAFAKLTSTISAWLEAAIEEAVYAAVTRGSIRGGKRAVRDLGLTAEVRAPEELPAIEFLPADGSNPEPTAKAAAAKSKGGRR